MGIQFDFAKCVDSIPYSVIWDVLSYHGCDLSFIFLLRNLYTNMNRCFRYAGCLGSFWMATNGLLQGDPLSVVILLRPLLSRLMTVDDISVYAFAMTLPSYFPLGTHFPMRSIFYNFSVQLLT